MASEKETPEEEVKAEETEQPAGEEVPEETAPAENQAEAAPPAEESAETAPEAAEETEPVTATAVVDANVSSLDSVDPEELRRMHSYEMIVIISPERDEEQVQANIDTISRFITGRGGVITEINRWGKRRLAYPIKHFIEGTYVLSHFNMKPEFGKELETSLFISEDILRHLLIKLDE